jgi:hypothetical protein
LFTPIKSTGGKKEDASLTNLAILKSDVCESQSYRLAKSLSDLNGTDPFIHDGTIEGVFRELGNMFRRPGRQPSVQQNGHNLSQVENKFASGFAPSREWHTLYRARVQGFIRDCQGRRGGGGALNELAG